MTCGAAGRRHITAEASEHSAWELQRESENKAREANNAMLHAAAAELQAKQLELKGFDHACTLALSTIH